MKIYLDIDGTMIHEEMGPLWGKPAAGLEEFIIALRPYETYWLTTHCMDGDPTRAREIMKRVLPEKLHPDIDRIKPTAWKIMKTEGIDWDAKELIWFDNDIFDEERSRFARAPKTQQLIEVNLKSNPSQLQEITRDLLQ